MDESEHTPSSLLANIHDDDKEIIIESNNLVEDELQSKIIENVISISSIHNASVGKTTFAMALAYMIAKNPMRNSVLLITDRSNIKLYYDTHTIQNFSETSVNASLIQRLKDAIESFKIKDGNQEMISISLLAMDDALFESEILECLSKKKFKEWGYDIVIIDGKYVENAQHKFLILNQDAKSFFNVTNDDLKMSNYTHPIYIQTTEDNDNFISAQALYKIPYSKTVCKHISKGTYPFVSTPSSDPYYAGINLILASLGYASDIIPEENEKTKKKNIFSIFSKKK